MGQQLSLSEASPIVSGGLKVCPECQTPFKPYRRAENRQIYCSHTCADRANKREHGRLKPVQISDKQTRCQRVLERLRKGPATALDLEIAGGGTEATRRLRELRPKGYVIRCDKSGEHPRYVLVSEPGEE